ncbi:MAG TPA: cytochrome c oxidase subunit II [Candidatus Paceibacterota bacterium]|nr:cytochrome c oxidase subunit II [Candidatus Paceibacterota bacterium]
MMESLYYLLGMPRLASQSGQGVDNLIVYIHFLMIALFVGWLCFFLYALFRFSKSRSPKADPVGVRSHVSNYIEFFVAGVEALLLVGVALPVWAHAVKQFPKPDESTVIQVVGQQFAWNARYAGPDGIMGKQDMKFVAGDNAFGVDPTDAHGKDDVQVLNEIHVPVNKPVIAYVSSKDVIHSFKVPAMRAQQDAIPGMRVPVWFKPAMEGRFQIYCAQLCGNGHASMAQGFIVVESQQAYDKWLASKSGAATSFE